MRRSGKQAAETRRNILQAAENLFLEKGYDNVSLEEVAATVGVSRGAVHWHFKNKEGVLFALCDKAQEPFRMLAENFAEHAGMASLAKLGDLIANIFEQLQNDPRRQAFIRVIVHFEIMLAEKGELGRTSSGTSIYQNLLQIFSSIERDFGLRPPWTPRMTASILSAAMSGLVREWGMSGGAFRLSPDGQAMIRLILSEWA